MATLRSSPALSRATPPPTAAWLEPPTDGCPTGVAVITDGKGRSSYHDVTEIECGFEGCRGFALTKFSVDREQYHVLLSMTNPADEGCDCKGHSRWNRCKHVTALRHLIGGQP
jgi:hypothetical protein